MSTHTPPSSPNAQRDFINRIVREVLARLSAAGQTPAGQSDGQAVPLGNPSSAVIDERIVTAKLISRLPGKPASVRVPHQAVITPSARDEAKRRSITIDACDSSTEPIVSSRPTDAPTSPGAGITDTQNPQRAEAVTRQLSFRGIRNIQAAVVLSDTPAGEVYRACTVQNHRSVMIASLGDVDRFAADLEPTHWVIDMARVNLTTAVNIISRIEQQSSTESPS